MGRILFRLAADTTLVGVALFAPAGTLSWPRAWVLLAVMLAVRAAGMIAVYRVNPALLRERAKLPLHARQPWADRLLLLAVLGTGFVGLPVVASLDVFRWQAWPRPAHWISAAGLGLFALGWILNALALRANAFATSVVRLQPEQAVVDGGPYGVVRHPFYLGSLLLFAGMGLWLESYLALLGGIVPALLVVVRLRLEERFLRRELPGYASYTARVRYRLVPGIW